MTTQQLNATPEQQAAIDTLIRTIQGGAKVVSLSGDAGTGKTLTIHHLIKDLAAAGFDGAVVTAFTNKAVKVLRSKGIKGPTTIHKRFYIFKEEQKGWEMVKRFVPCDKQPGQLPEGKVKSVRCAIVDEASMVHSETLADLKRMADVLILVGDGFQLPPVGDTTHPIGMFNELTHTATLTKVHRQTTGSSILEIAGQIRKWQENQINIWDRKVFASITPDTVQGIDGVIANLEATGSPWCVITATNSTRHQTNQTIRKTIGRNSLFPQPGDRMLVTANVADELTNGTEITVVECSMPTVDQIREMIVEGQTSAAKYQGEIPHEQRRRIAAVMTPTLRFTTDDPDGYGPVTSSYSLNINSYLKTYHPEVHAALGVDHAMKLMKVDQENDACFEFAYAITAHKAQGSEFDHVFIIDERSVTLGRIRAAEAMGEKTDWVTETKAMVRWWYTAITRAKKTVTVI